MKILYVDIETAPNISYIWGKYEQNSLAFLRESYLMCVAYKWEGQKTQVKALPDFPAYQQTPHDDRELTQLLYDLFDEADIIIAHNGDQFDIKYANGRFLVHKLHPPNSYRTVDTLKIARQTFKLNSNKLDDLGTTLGIGSKVETGGFKLWLGCLDGDMKSWDKMKKYNKQDVDLLYSVYHRLKGWKKGHPSITLDIEETERPQCSTCGSLHVQKGGYEFKAGGKSQRWKCQDCGANLYTNVRASKPLRT